MSFFNLNKLDKIIRVHKDLFPDSSKRNVIYQINCNDCDASYMDQMSRKLKTSISKHFIILKEIHYYIRL